MGDATTGCMVDPSLVDETACSDADNVCLMGSLMATDPEEACTATVTGDYGTADCAYDADVEICHDADGSNCDSLGCLVLNIMPALIYGMTCALGGLGGEEACLALDMEDLTSV